VSALNAVLTVLVGAFVFGASGLIGVTVALALVPKLKPFEDGPAPVRVNPYALIGGAAVLGAFMAWRHVPTPELLTSAVLAGVLAAIWYCDARTGIVPDAFTLVPLGLAFLDAYFAQQFVQVLVSAAVLFTPFALGAVFSKGRGMGWGDAKLAALAGAMLGMMLATLSLGIASLIAVIVASIRYRSKPVPIAFAPYMVAAIALGVAYKAL
jgi:prepilin signal peptidase PulO-like enzyme (type II secretory pathway)